MHEESPHGSLLADLHKHLLKRQVKFGRSFLPDTNEFYTQTPGSASMTVSAGPDAERLQHVS